jgi:hypothetical protein
MPHLTRRESEDRQQALLNFFLQNPSATGDEGQKALIDGRLGRVPLDVENRLARLPAAQSLRLL